MKQVIKYVSLLVVALLVVTTAIAGGKSDPQLSRLPQKAQQMIKKNFSKEKIVHVNAKSSITAKTFDVMFGNGTKVVFDKNGDWTEVDCRNNAVPSDLVPKQIRDYVNKQHKKAKITSIKKEKNKYDIQLSNGMKISFDKNYRVTKIK